MKAKPKSTVVATPQYTEFLRLFALSGEYLTQAAQLLVKLVDADQDVFEHIITACPGTNFEMLQGLYRCGKIGMDPRVMLANPIAARRVLALPSPVAREVAQHGLPVATPGQTSAALVLKPVSKLSARDLQIAVKDDGSLRSAKEQIEAANAPKPPSPPRYTIHPDGSVTFQDRCKFSAAEISDISRECTLSAIRLLAKSASTKAVA